MKVQIDKSEWCPVFVIETDADEMHEYLPVIDLPGELVEKHDKIMKEFWKLQEELEPLFMKQGVVNGRLAACLEVARKEADSGGTEGS